MWNQHQLTLYMNIYIRPLFINDFEVGKVFQTSWILETKFKIIIDKNAFQ